MADLACRKHNRKLARERSEGPSRVGASLLFCIMHGQRCRNLMGKFDCEPGITLVLLLQACRATQYTVAHPGRHLYGLSPNDRALATLAAVDFVPSAVFAARRAFSCMFGR